MEATVWRAENSDGIGMFRSVETVQISIETGINDRHSTFNDPWNDGLNMYKDNQDWKCAYKSEDQMKMFITPEEFRYIISIGFKVFKIKTSEFQEGKDQFIFTERGIIEKIDITNQFI